MNEYIRDNPPENIKISRNKEMWSRYRYLIDCMTKMNREITTLQTIPIGELAILMVETEYIRKELYVDGIPRHVLVVEGDKGSTVTKTNPLSQAYEKNCNQVTRLFDKLGMFPPQTKKRTGPKGTTHGNESDEGFVNGI